MTLAILEDRPILMTILSSAVAMAISSIIDRSHSKLNILVIVFSTISFFIACDQFRRAFVTWRATGKKLSAVEPQDA